MRQPTMEWSSQLSFIFAASAAAIGLGNIWRFPYIVGQNGGGAFVLMYLLAVLLLGVPLIIAEVVLGRMGRKNAIATFASLAKQSKRSSLWGLIGALNILSGFLIMTYYVVIAGWVLDYLFRAGIGEFHNITEAGSLLAFNQLKSSPWQMLLTDTIVCASAIGILMLGLKRGLERAVMIMFPALLILLALLLIHSITHGSFARTIHFLFSANFHAVTAKTALIALGQAFFSLNIAMGVTITFSAYLPKRNSITQAAYAVVIADTGFAILAGLIIFPIVFAYHLKASAGPSLIFKTLPLAFGHMAFGHVVASLFFLMLFFAAFSSIIAVLEPSIDWLQANRGFNRKKAVLGAGTICWLLSLGAIGSFSHPHIFQIFHVSFFKALDFTTAAIMLPIGGLLIAVFAGWLLCPHLLLTELNWSLQNVWVRIWRFILRYFAPLAILFILLGSLGLL
ncbi:MAG: sodium-dependent transporter [Gammaproteobacteria bacterium]|nr:sodium-dependent transporter [Gammaproteobacteria bacterium]